MVKNITIGSRVSAPRGPFLEKAPGRDRARRSLWFGDVISSVGPNVWKVRYDNGEIRDEKSTQLKQHHNMAGREPLVPISPVINSTQRQPRIDDRDVPEPLPAPPALAATPCPSALPPSAPVRESGSSGNASGVSVPFYAAQLAYY